jgi:hypothetical protein
VAGADVLSTIHVDADFGHDLSHAMLMCSGTGSGGPGITFTNLSIRGLGSGNFGSPLDASAFGDSYAMLGLAGGTGSGGDGFHLVMSIGHLTHIDGVDFSTAFPGYSEAQIIDSLLLGSSLAEDFLRDRVLNAGVHLGETSRVVGFSAGVDIGEVTVSLVPVPAPSAFAALPLALLRRRRRR